VVGLQSRHLGLWPVSSLAIPCFKSAFNCVDSECLESPAAYAAHAARRRWAAPTSNLRPQEGNEVSATVASPNCEHSPPSTSSPVVQPPPLISGARLLTPFCQSRLCSTAICHPDAAAVRRHGRDGTWPWLCRGLPQVLGRHPGQRDWRQDLLHSGHPGDAAPSADGAHARRGQTRWGAAAAAKPSGGTCLCGNPGLLSDPLLPYGATADCRRCSWAPLELWQP
jgi:hypothetical protein